MHLFKIEIHIFKAKKIKKFIWIITSKLYKTLVSGQPVQLFAAMLQFTH
jgi:hypothetical protein